MIQHSLPLISATTTRTLLKRAKEQPNEAAVIAFTRRTFEDGIRLIDGEHRLLNAEVTLASTLLNVRGVVKFVSHRIAEDALA